MTIDEAIAHAREVAEDKRADADWKFRHGRLNADDCISCAEEHEQIAEWLEELKAYREIGTVEGYKSAIECYTKEYLLRRNLQDQIKEQYNKAIDDCKELTFREVVYCDSLNDRTEFRELAEQLKAGGENDRCRNCKGC